MELTQAQYQQLHRVHAFHSGLQKLTQLGAPEAAYQWVLDHGYSESAAQAEREMVLRLSQFC